MGLCLSPIVVVAAENKAQTQTFDVLPEQKWERGEPKVNVQQIEQQSEIIQNQENQKKQANQSDTLHIDAQDLAKQPELLRHAFFSALQTRNVEALKLLLPIYQKQEDYDAIAVHLAKGYLARSEGQYPQAIQEFKKVLDKHEDFPEAKMGLAQSYFENHQNISAEKHFSELQKAELLPQQFRTYAGEYLKELKKRRKPTFSIGANYTEDKNINNAPKDLNPRGWKLEPPKKANGIAYHLGVEKNMPFADHWSIRSQANVQGKFYWNNHNYDDLNVRFGMGAVRQTARSEMGFVPYVERRWYGTKKYARETGISTHASYWVTPKNQLIGSLDLNKQKHDKRNNLDGNTTSFSGTWVNVIHPRLYWMVGADFSRKRAKDASSAYRRQGIRLGMNYRWQNGLNVNASLGIGRRTYDDAIIFNQTKRVDKDYYASVGVSHQKIQIWNVQPRLVAQWNKSKSTHPFYGTYSKANIFIQLNKSF